MNENGLSWFGCLVFGFVLWSCVVRGVCVRVFIVCAYEIIYTIHSVYTGI